MTNEDQAAMERLMTSILAAHTATINGQFKVITNDLGYIKEQTTKTNGRVTKLEAQYHDSQLTEAQHFQNCPAIHDLEMLKIERASRLSLRNFLVYAGSFVVGSAAVVVAVIEIIRALN